MDTQRSFFVESGRYTTKYLRILRICFTRPFDGRVLPPQPSLLIQYVTFEPVMLSSGGIIGIPLFERFSETMKRAMSWLNKSSPGRTWHSIGLQQARGLDQQELTRQDLTFYWSVVGTWPGSTRTHLVGLGILLVCCRHVAWINKNSPGRTLHRRSIGLYWARVLAQQVHKCSPVRTWRSIGLQWARVLAQQDLTRKRRPIPGPLCTGLYEHTYIYIYNNLILLSHYTESFIATLLPKITLHPPEISQVSSVNVRQDPEIT